MRLPAIEVEQVTPGGVDHPPPLSVLFYCFFYYSLLNCQKQPSGGWGEIPHPSFGLRGTSTAQLDEAVEQKVQLDQ